MTPALEHRVYALLEVLRGDLNSPEWSGLLAEIQSKSLQRSVHVAIFVEPFLSYILNGLKTIDCRLGRSRIAPYGRVKPGDAILLKLSGGDIVGICRAGEVISRYISSTSLEVLLRANRSALCMIEDDFWKERRERQYVTLVQLEAVSKVGPVPFPRRERSGWQVLCKSEGQLRLDY